MYLYILASLIGVSAGLRAMTAPAVVSWAAYAGWLPVEGTWLEFLGYIATPYVLTLLAIGELVNDKLPHTPSRKALMPFLSRLSTGAVCGAAIVGPAGSTLAAVSAGMAGAAVGTLAGYELRARLANAIGGRELPVAIAEDVIAVGGAITIVSILAA